MYTLSSPSSSNTHHLSTCPACHHTLRLPPSYHELYAANPRLIYNKTINRSYPRCRHCDYKRADRQAMEAECPPPDYVSTTKKIYEDIEKSHNLMAQGVRVKEIKEALPRMWEKLEDAERRAREGVEEAWKGFEAIWGEERDPR